MRRLAAILILLVFLLGLYISFVHIPSQATRIYGPPAGWLSLPERVQYGALLLWYDGLLTHPLDPAGQEQPFTIEVGESVDSLSSHLELAGLIRDADSFRAYLIYSGLDTSIQAGDYELSAAMSAINIAHELQDATPHEVTFIVLPGWRVEEIAESLPTSGLPITYDEFLAAAQASPDDFDFLEGAESAEGFLFPDSYVLMRDTDATALVQELVRNFSLHLTLDIRNGFSRQGLSVYEAVTLASMVQREAVREEEQPLIASVYLNRLRIEMKLDADPTVQYAIGYNILQRTWWTNPLTLLDLQLNSPYNTYMYTGLPPGPIANPGLGALRAVAFPAETNYFFFRANCDRSGFHEFAETFEEHLGNACQ